MKPLLFLCIVFHLVVSVVGQSRHPLKRTLFLDKYLAQKGYIYPLRGGFDAFLDLRPWSSDFKAGGQQMIRTDSNLYIFVESSGRLYKAVDKDSSNIYFQRIDSNLGVFTISGLNSLQIGNIIVNTISCYDHIRLIVHNLVSLKNYLIHNVL